MIVGGDGGGSLELNAEGALEEVGLLEGADESNGRGDEVHTTGRTQRSQPSPKNWATSRVGRGRFMMVPSLSRVVTRIKKGGKSIL